MKHDDIEALLREAGALVKRIRMEYIEGESPDAYMEVVKDDDGSPILVEMDTEAADVALRIITKEVPALIETNERLVAALRRDRASMALVHAAEVMAGTSLSNLERATVAQREVRFAITDLQPDLEHEKALMDALMTEHEAGAFRWGMDDHDIDCVVEFTALMRFMKAHAAVEALKKEPEDEPKKEADE